MDSMGTLPEASFRSADIRTGWGFNPLYHYTQLACLAPIVRAGLIRGDLPVDDPRRPGPVVSLTTQADPGEVRIWGAITPVKLAVRFHCLIDPADPRLEPASRTWRRTGVPRDVAKLLDPLGHAKWWAHYFGPVLPGSFAVELRSRKGYVPVSGTELERVVCTLEEQIGIIHSIALPNDPAVIGMVFGPECDFSLVREEYPADRFGIGGS